MCAASESVAKYCAAGILGMPRRLSSECVGNLECASNACAALTRPEVDYREVETCREEYLEEIGPESSDVPSSTPEPVAAQLGNKLPTIRSALMLVGSLILAAHTFAATKLPDSPRCQMLRICLCVSTGLSFFLAICLQVAIAVRSRPDFKSLAADELKTESFANCVRSVLDLSDISSAGKRVKFISVYIAARSVSIFAVSVAAVLEVVRTERLQRRSGQQNVRLRDRWIFLIIISFVLFALNTGVTALSSHLAGRYYLPDYEGCEQKRFDKSVLSLCDANVVLGGYKYLGEGVSEACRSLERKVQLGRRPEYCSGEGLVDLLRSEGATNFEIRADSTLVLLTQEYIQGTPPVTVVNGRLGPPIALLCIAVINGVALILFGWNVGVLLVLGLRRKRVLILALLYILLHLYSWV